MPGTILIVEDEPAIADNIVYALSTEGFAVTWCATGGEARAILADREIRMVILDVGLPDCNGFDLCREIRKSSNVPILFLTARSDEIDRVVGLEIGADDYVVKPFSPRELSARVKAILRRVPAGENRDGTKNPTSSFAIEPNKRRISFFGEWLVLSRYEYRILEVLIRRPGWVFSRDRIMQQAWEEPGFSTDRAVDTHIKTIRAKLRAVRPDANPIRTHRGVGYSLEESM